MSKVIAFVTYESPWFPAGGIAAVMGQVPSAVQSAGGFPTVVITPFHEKAAKIAVLKMQGIGTIQMAYDLTPVSVEVLHYTADCPWFFLKVDDSVNLKPVFFDGDRHPYSVANELLLRDSLFFGAATVQALPIIAKHLKVDLNEVEWNLIAQDWEAATGVLAFASQNNSHGRLHLTLRNSYDEFATSADFSRVGINPASCPGDTILHRALSVIEPPAFTVSGKHRGQVLFLAF